MEYVGLLLFAAVMWLLVSYAATARARLAARSNGEEASDVPVLAYVTAPPAVFTGLAYVIDRARPAMGFWVVFGVHAFIGIVAVALALRGRALLSKTN